MRDINWLEIGLTESQASVADSFSVGSEHASLAHELAIWQQWVVEVERGANWVLVEVDSACEARNSLDEMLGLLPESIADVVFDWVDGLDMRYRDATVFTPDGFGRGSESRAGSRDWWWSRIPIRNRPRLFLRAELPASEFRG